MPNIGILKAIAARHSTIKTKCNSIGLDGTTACDLHVHVAGEFVDRPVHVPRTGALCVVRVVDVHLSGGLVVPVHHRHRERLHLRNQISVRTSNLAHVCYRAYIGNVCP